MSNFFGTKKALSDALKSLCMEKPYNNISISDIMVECHMNRQSFYYHFKNKSDLLLWTYENSDFGIIIGNYNEDKSKQMFYPLKAMQDEKDFFINTIKSNTMVFERFLFQKISIAFAENLKTLDVNNILSIEQCNFLSGYYSLGLCGIIVKWASDGMIQDAEKIADGIKCLDFKSIFEVYLKNHLND